MDKIQYRGKNSDVGPSPEIWWDSQINEYLLDPSQGFFVADDFVNVAQDFGGTTQVAWDRYRAFASTGGSVATPDVLGGALTLSSDGDDEGAGLAQSNACFQLDRDVGTFWFEARLKVSTIADTTLGFFLGLADATAMSATSVIAAAGTLADINFCGFHRLEADGDKVDTVYKADGVLQVDVENDMATLVADTYIKLGMKLKDNVLTFYANGVPSVTTKTIPTADGTDFPNDVRMGLILQVLNAAGSSPGTVSIDWWRAAQTRV